MNLPELQGLGILLTPTAAPALTRAWQVGQILDAQVLARSPHQGSVQLRLGATTVEARTELPLQPGTSVKLEVVSRGENGPVVLRVLTPPNAEAQTMQQALRAALPRQAELKPLLMELAQLAGSATRAPSASTSLPAPVAALVKALVDRLPAANTLQTPAGLRQALTDSGSFLEARLGQGNAPPANDFKAALLQLRQALLAQAPAAPTTSAPAPTADNASATLLTRIDAALARVQLNQLSALPADVHGKEMAAATPARTDAPVPLVVELPVRDGHRPDVLRFSIEADAHGGAAETGAPRWTVWLELSPGDLGPVRARVHVQGDTAAVNFWAERETTARLFADHLGELDAGLRAAGLTTGPLASRHGVPAGQPAAPLPAQCLLDERA